MMHNQTTAHITDDKGDTRVSEQQQFRAAAQQLRDVSQRYLGNTGRTGQDWAQLHQDMAAALSTFNTAQIALTGQSMGAQALTPETGTNYVTVRCQAAATVTDAAALSQWAASHLADEIDDAEQAVALCDVLSHIVSVVDHLPKAGPGVGVIDVTLLGAEPLDVETFYAQTPDHEDHGMLAESVETVAAALDGLLKSLGQPALSNLQAVERVAAVREALLDLDVVQMADSLCSFMALHRSGVMSHGRMAEDGERLMIASVEFIETTQASADDVAAWRDAAQSAIDGEWAVLRGIPGLQVEDPSVSVEPGVTVPLPIGQLTHGELLHSWELGEPWESRGDFPELAQDTVS